ncbi:hypothetical protein H2202_003738 [Exophiala xenobiotica]|nr:hypothetical protein H2202_003738 [Exophiala xenobiotica]KAK5213453.1 hypothetical protein LTR41_001032 [Exophiala xenobiotica]
MGSNAARYGEILAGIISVAPGSPSSYKEVLRGLKLDSEKLYLVEADFSSLLNRNIPASQKIQLYSFQGGKGVTGIKPFGSKTSFINANHMDMARFESDSSQGYRDFRSALKGYLIALQTRGAQQRRLENSRQLAERSAVIRALDFKERLSREQQLSNITTPPETFTWVWSSIFLKWLRSDSSLFWISGKPASGKSTMMHYLAKSKELKDVLHTAGGRDWEIIHFFFDFRAGNGIGNNFDGFIRSLLVQLADRLADFNSLVPELSQHLKVPSIRSEIHSNWEIPPNLARQSVLKCLQDCRQGLLILIDGLDEYEGQKVELTKFIKKLCISNVKVCVANRPDPPFPDAFAGSPSFQMQDLNYGAIRAFALDTLSTFYSSRQFEDTALQSLAKEIAQRALGVFLWARFAAYEMIDGLTRGEELGSPQLETRLDAVPPELQKIYSRIFGRLSPNDKRIAGHLLLFITSSKSILTVEMLQEAVGLFAKHTGPYGRNAIDYAEPSNNFRKRLFATSGGTVEVYPARLEYMMEEFHGHVVRLIHRTVKTYLEHEGWRELFGDSFHSGLGDEIWLQVCGLRVTKSSNLDVQYDDPGYWAYDLHLISTDTSSNDEAADHGKVDTHSASAADDTDILDTLMLTYAVSKALEYAEDWEDACKRSSAVLLKPLMTAAYFKAHCAVSNGDCLCYVADTFTRLSDVAADPIHLALYHGLEFCIKEYVEAQCATKTVGHKRGLLSKLNLAPDGFGKPRKASKLQDLTDVAIHTFCNYSVWGFIDDRHMRTFAILLKLYPTVSDEDLLSAVCNAPAEVLRLILDHQRSGKMILTGGTRVRVYSVLPRTDVFEQPEKYRPLAALGHRKSGDVKSVLDMFLDRGEDINEQCGPLGGVIHYTAAVPNGRTLEVLDLLIQEGADVNQPGPEGTPLEFLWKEANTRTLTFMTVIHVSGYRDALRHLIDLGAVHNATDPNGLVPSVRQMRHFGCNLTDYRECLRYYREGPLDGVSIWSRPVAVDPEEESPMNDLPSDKWSLPEHEASPNLEDDDRDNGSGQSEDDYHSIDDVPTLNSERTSSQPDVARAGEGHERPGSTALS